MTLPEHLIDRLRVRASGGSAADSHAIDIRVPFTGDLLYRLPLSTENEVDRAFSAARAAQPAWAATSIRDRSRLLLTFHDLVLQRRDEAMDLVQTETGKARRDALEEVLDIAVTTRHYARDSRRLLRARRQRGALPVLVGVRQLHHPKGVVGIIAPWNYPLTLAASDAVPALLAGNAVVLKPDVQTTLCALWVADLLAEVGLPPGLFQVVPGEGPVVGPMVVERADYVMFTGSTRTGREVARRCGERLVGCSLELGGKNSVIVCADADLDRAAETAVRACFGNSGQLCISTERMYVVESVREEFLARFLPRVRGMRLHARADWGADMGSLISPTQLDRVRAHVDDAVSRGARVLAGGKARPDIGPCFYEPTVLDGVTEDMALCRDETFGPVVSIYSVADEEEAIARANDTAYGLNDSVLCGDRRRGARMAARLRSGTVNVNEGYAAAWGSTRAPMGGMGDSGLGRRHGDEGLLKFTEPQTIAVQRALGFGAPFGWSDRRWGEFLARAVGLLKRIGAK